MDDERYANSLRGNRLVTNALIELLTWHK